MTENPEESLKNYIESDDDYALNTSTIYHREYSFVRDPESYAWKKLPSDYPEQLEQLVQQLLVENVEPRVDYSKEQRERLIQRNNKFHEAHFSIGAFRLQFFVIATNVPRIKHGKNILSYTGDQYYYLYFYDQPLKLRKKDLKDFEFELLFAFALRQCDLMKIDSFLQYHLVDNFGGKVKEYCKYLIQINRKFIGIFFTPELFDSVKDWVTVNENKQDVSITKKIKTDLTVDQLAFLFKALAVNHHFEDNTLTEVFEWVCENFESKRMADISVKSMHNNFYTTPPEVLDFWEDNFDKLSKIAIRFKQKIKP